MAKRKTRSSASESRLFVLALGLLVGFVIAFVLILSRMPVDEIISQHNGAITQGAEVTDMNFDYYAVLQEQRAERRPASAPVLAIEPPVVFTEPPRDVLAERRAAVDERLPVPAPAPAQKSVSEPVIAIAPAPRTAPAAQLPRIQPSQPQPAPVEPLRVEPRVQRPQVAPPVVPAPQVREMLASESSQDSYFVEAGSYRTDREARRAQSTLLGLGIDAFIVVRQSSDGVFGHRVRIGPFVEQNRLDATREALRSSGIAAKLIRVKG